MIIERTSVQGSALLDRAVVADWKKLAPEFELLGPGLLVIEQPVGKIRLCQERVWAAIENNLSRVSGRTCEAGWPGGWKALAYLLIT